MKFYQISCELGIVLNLIVIVCATQSEFVNLSTLSFPDRKRHYEQFHRKYTKRGHWKNKPALKKMYCDVLEKYATLLQKLTGRDALHEMAGRQWEDSRRYRREVRNDIEYQVYGKVVHRKKPEVNPLGKFFSSLNSRTKRGLRSSGSTKKLTERIREIMELTHRLEHRDNSHDTVIDGSGDGEVGPTDIVISTTSTNRGTESAGSAENNNHSIQKVPRKKDNPHVSDCDESYRHYCFNGGTCFRVKALNQTSCSCPEGFTGNRCQEHINRSVLQVLEYGIFIGAAGIENLAIACGKPEYIFLRPDIRDKI
ncbi:uncharacterized protein LOC106164964 [Lingula anatina]|uniref:Uncharacterized protein LOC106164964 n=1 Tax=Lingula anatina TaxID=7574 RepID=A0A1S3IKR6_LINAN|nr:uncharacterized protein LOC106164964 [Lingula anatina]|eukprot:XP_013398481.1 uncharacterized protein LOC106164964 [Lingula anatina]